jgi:hypothetical protein
MDNVLLALFSWQFLLFCLMTFGITFVIRKIVEYFMANNKIVAKESKLWRDLILPLLPIFVGVATAVIAKQFPYPVDMHSTSARVAWGLSGGLLSGLGYRVVSSFITAFILSKMPNADIKDPNFTPDPIVNIVTTIPAAPTPVPVTSTEIVTVPVPVVAVTPTVDANPVVNK